MMGVPTPPMRNTLTCLTLLSLFLTTFAGLEALGLSSWENASSLAGRCWPAGWSNLTSNAAAAGRYRASVRR